MVVDGAYQAWYLDVIAVGVLPPEEDPSDETLLEALERSGISYPVTRYLGGAREGPADGDGCTWPEARAAVQEIVGPARGNTAAYLILGREGAVVQAQWEALSEAGLESQAIVERAERLSAALGCISPPVDKLEIFVVDGAGRTRVYVRVVGVGAPPLTPGQFKVYYLSA